MVRDIFSLGEDACLTWEYPSRDDQRQWIPRWGMNNLTASSAFVPLGPRTTSAIPAPPGSRCLPGRRPRFQAAWAFLAGEVGSQEPIPPRVLVVPLEDQIIHPVTVRLLRGR